MERSFITDISILNSITRNQETLRDCFERGLLSDSSLWEEYELSKVIDGLKNEVKSPLRKRMSQLSLGVYYTLTYGGGRNINKEDEIYLFSAFGEIDTTNKIIKSITVDGDSLVSPTHFHNSVHNTPLSYYTIINGLHNYCATLSDGLESNLAFINFINNLIKVKDSFIVVSGEEYSDFFSLDRTRELKIVPSYCSYRIERSLDRGFVYCGTYESLDLLKKSDVYRGVEALFVDKDSFFQLYDGCDKALYTDYPLVYDNPCAVSMRLALPFYLEFSGRSAIVEEVGGSYHLFEVLL